MYPLSNIFLTLSLSLSSTVPPTNILNFPSVSSRVINYNDDVRFLEHVVVQLTAVFEPVGGILQPQSGDIELDLTSPMGTTSNLLPRRPQDTRIGGYRDWPFMSVHFWGEDPSGDWTLTVRNHGFIGTLVVRDIRFTFYGTAQVPAAVARIPQQCHELCLRDCAAPGPEFCDACRQLRLADNLMCVDECPPGQVERRGYCYNPLLPEPACLDAAEYTCKMKCEDGCSKGMVYKIGHACYDICLLRHRKKEYILLQT